MRLGQRQTGRCGGMGVMAFAAVDLTAAEIQMFDLEGGLLAVMALQALTRNVLRQKRGILARVGLMTA